MRNDSEQKGERILAVLAVLIRDVQDVAPQPMLEAVAAADARMQAKRTAALEEVYADRADSSPRGGRR